MHGEPDQSLDVALILIALPSRAAALSDSLIPRFYAPQEMLVQASKTAGFVNVIDNQTSMKIDLHL